MPNDKKLAIMLLLFFMLSLYCIGRLQTKVEKLEEAVVFEKTKNTRLVLQNNVAVKKSSPLEIREVTVTAYAPLDPNAIEGMCYQGDPEITASGEKVTPGVTVAAGPDIPFGTRVYIEGIGWRIVQDRGGKVGNNALDIAVLTKEEALSIGKSNKLVIIEWEANQN